MSAGPRRMQVGPQDRAVFGLYFGSPHNLCLSNRVAPGASGLFS
jgi:hypothetical protein